MKIEPQNMKKTKPDFLKAIFKPSVLSNTLHPQTVFFLNTIGKYEETTENNRKILKINEHKNNLSISFNSKNKFHIKQIIPNFLGRGEQFNLTLDSNKNYGFEISKPVLNLQGIVGCKVGNFNKLLFQKYYKTDFVKFFMKKINQTFSLNFENVKSNKRDKKVAFVKAKTGNNIFTSSILAGAYKKYNSVSFFEKVEVKVQKEFKIGNFFWFFNSGFGMIFGKTHKIHRFFLGQNIPGFKSNTVCPSKSGGEVFCQLKNEIGYNIKNFKFYAFAAQAFCCNAKNIVDILQHFFVAQIEQPKRHDLATSVGVGLKIPFTNEKQINIMIAKPLISSSDNKSIVFDFDF